MFYRTDNVLSADELTHIQTDAGCDAARALGADAVLLGRPYIYALSQAGAQGVAHCLRLFLDELEAAQTLLGCPHLSLATRHLAPSSPFPSGERLQNAYWSP